jgi:hypothetical protein
MTTPSGPRSAREFLAHTLVSDKRSLFFRCIRALVERCEEGHVVDGLADGDGFVCNGRMTGLTLG